MAAIISIIIPIYNASKHLERCLKSVLNQTFIDFELILVNDGSIDNSLQICKNFQRHDNRVKIIDQDNQGVSEARNIGFENSKGEYILHVDADDWLEPTMLQELYHKASLLDADIVECGIYVDSPAGLQNTFLFPYYQEVGQKLLRIHMGYSAVWNKLVKRNLYSDFDIKGEKGITMWEDNLVTMKLRYHSKNTICLQKPLYHYWVGEGNSMCDSLRLRFPTSEIKVAAILSEYFSNLPDHNKLSKRCIANLRVLAKESIWKNNEWGGVAKWKEVLPISTYQIWLSQLSLSKKTFFSLINILPVNITGIMIKFIKAIIKR